MGNRDPDRWPEAEILARLYLDRYGVIPDRLKRYLELAEKRPPATRAQWGEGRHCGRDDCEPEA